MTNYKKKFLILIIFLVLIVPFFIQAKDRVLEVEYPKINGWKPESVKQSFLPDYIKYIFNFAIIIGGLIVFGALIYGGIRWMTSTGNPTALGDAQKQIIAGFLGMIILLLSWLILYTIDPELTFFNLDNLAKIRAVSVPGVYLSSETHFPSDQDIESNAKKVYYTLSSISSLKKILTAGETIKSLKFVNQLGFTISIQKGDDCPEGTTLSPLTECFPFVDSLMIGTVECCTPDQEPEPPSFYYGVVVHEKPNMQGNCNFYRSVNLNSYNEPNINPEPESITVFQESKTAFGNVIAYENIDHLGQGTLLPMPIFPDKWKKLKELGLENKIQSIKINGDFLLILKSDTTGCVVIFKSSADLKEYNIDKCNCEFRNWWWRCDNCASEYALIPSKSIAITVPMTEGGGEGSGGGGGGAR